MKVGFTGLGNAGAEFAVSLLRNGHNTTVQDFDKDRAKPLLEADEHRAESPKHLTAMCELVIACGVFCCYGGRQWRTPKYAPR